jgi:sulfate adenylyltransferase
VPNQLVSPHGGQLTDLTATRDRSAQLKEESRNWPSWDLTARQLCDLELLANGGFSPLQGWLGEQDYQSVCNCMRLSDGTLWPIPVNLDLTEERAAELGPGDMLALRDPEGVMIAAVHISELYRPDLELEAKLVYGTTDVTHPGVAYLLEKTNPVYAAGLVEVVAHPVHYDHKALRHSPAQLRAAFEDLGWSNVVAFQTRNPMHRAHVELTLRAARKTEANLLIHPSVGMTKPGDVDHHTRVRCYEAVLKSYPRGTAALSLLPLAMRMAGPREAVWHAIIRKNHGASHFIVGRDHAGPGNDSAGQPFYGPYEAQDLLAEHSGELGVGMVPFQQMVYVPAKDEYMPVDEVPPSVHTLDISGTELRRRLAEGREIPSWFTFPEVAAELRRSFPPRSRQGFTVFFTGLSGAGKSTVASILLTKLLEEGGRPTTLLDGDVVRKHLSSELGFSKEHRDINIRRIGWVASEITKNGGIAICAPIAPYEAVRQEVRSMIEPLGGFVLVHVSTPIEVCEERDRKGLYAKARAGLVKEFTGVSDPYEVPPSAEVRIDTTATSAEAAAQQVILHLQAEGYLAGDEG